ncbi:hypothetical protein KHC28_24035 [Ancylobacter sonchi]|uniref:hypothetical protein n=1 Tax=Ancylobacter sonchi TaxID=1937790 RepID=UPI001BD3D6FB|nr:hypothetical protein [Ancylobacter sonchi]MBS7536727.1 hypothetical protein [Ancylobacter sonchi]
MKTLFTLPPELPNWTGPRVSQSPEGLALASIPDWLVMVQPEYATSDGLLNRAAMHKRAPLRNPVSALPSPGLTFPNGQPAFAPGANGGLWINSEDYVDANVNVGDFTVFATLLRTAATAPYIWDPLTSATVGQRSFSLAIQSTTHLLVVRQFSGGSTTTAMTGVEVTIDTPHLVLMSYSAERGLTLRQDGVQRGNSAAGGAINRPGAIDQMGSLLNGSSTFAVRYGLSGIINRDLTKTANAAYLAQLEGYLMDRYDVT